jgi:hypothetical protein
MTTVVKIEDPRKLSKTRINEKPENSEQNQTSTIPRPDTPAPNPLPAFDVGREAERLTHTQPLPPHKELREVYFVVFVRFSRDLSPARSIIPSSTFYLLLFAYSSFFPSFISIPRFICEATAALIICCAETSPVILISGVLYYSVISTSLPKKLV